MSFATHLIKIRGEFEPEKWTEKKLREYIEEKMRAEIYDFYHPDLELFKIEEKKDPESGIFRYGKNIEVWVYIHALPLEATDDVIEKWLKNHIPKPWNTAEGIIVEEFEIENIVSIIDYFDRKKRPKFIIELP